MSLLAVLNLIESNRFILWRIARHHFAVCTYRKKTTVRASVFKYLCCSAITGQFSINELFLTMDALLSADRRTGMAVSHRYGLPATVWKIRVHCKGYESTLAECPHFGYLATTRTVFISCNNIGTQKQMSLTKEYGSM